MRIGRGYPQQSFSTAGRALGPRAPRFDPQPPPVDQTIAVTNVAVQSRRLSEKRRYPLQGWEGSATYETGGSAAITNGAAQGSSSGTVGGGTFGSGTARAETLTTSVAIQISSLSVGLGTNGTPTDDVVISIQDDASGVPSGTPLAGCSGQIPAASITAAQRVFTIAVSLAALPGVTYWVVVERDGPGDAINLYSVKAPLVVPGGSTFVFAFRNGNTGVWAQFATPHLWYSAQTAGSLRGDLARCLGPRPPSIVNPAANTASPVVTTLLVLSTAIVQRAQLQRHELKSLLFPPATLAQPPPAPPVVVSFAQSVQRASRSVRPTLTALPGPTVVATPEEPSQRVQTIQAASVLVRPPLLRSRLSPPTVVTPAATAFVAAPISVTLVENREHGIGRRSFPGSVLFAPRTLQVFAAGKVTLARIRPRPTIRTLARPVALQVFASGKPAVAVTRPRKTIWRLGPPTVLRVPAVEQQEDTIRVVFVRTRPRPTSANLAPPTTLQAFVGPTVAVTRLRPRKTSALLFRPTVLRIPSVEQREDTITTALSRVRPRPTARELRPPTALQVFAAAKVTLTAARPRPTAAALTPPTIVRVPAVEQLEQTIRVTLTRARPRPTLRRLRPPTVLRVPAVEQQEQTLRVRLAQTRPRPTSKRLAPPTVIVTNPPVVTTIRVALVSLRPPVERTRHVVEHLLRPPTAVTSLPSLRAQTITVRLARIRPVRTHAVLTAVSYRAVSKIQASLVRVRPRRTISVLGEPTALQVFSGPAVHVVRRPRSATLARFTPPTLEPESVQIAERTIRTALVRVRPRNIVSALREPTALQVFAGPVEHEIAVSTVLERRRHAPHSRLLPPLLLAVAAAPLRVTLARTRPRATLSSLPAPTAVTAAQTVPDRIRVALARIRPRRTAAFVLAPRVRPPAETQIAATFARIRPATTAATLAAPTVVRAQEAFSGPATKLAPGRRPTTHALLSPPRVLAAPAPPTPEQLRLAASLTAIQTRLRFRVGRSVFPPVLPPAPPETLPPFPESTGYAASGADAPGEALPAADSTGQASPGTASQGAAVPVAESTGNAVPGTASDGG